MPADDEVRRAPDSLRAQPEFDEIKRHTESVIEDHHRYRDVQNRNIDSVRPPSFEYCLEAAYELRPHPLPEDEVESVTHQAVEAMTQERESAGGKVFPEAVPLQEPELRSEADEFGLGDGPSSRVEKGEGPESMACDERVLPPPMPIDFYQLAQLLEDRVAKRFEQPLTELGAGIAGLGFRIDRILLQRVEKPEVPEGPSSVPAADIQAIKPEVPGGSGKPVTIQERRQERTGQRTSGGRPGEPREEAPVASKGRSVATAATAPAANGPKRKVPWRAAAWAASVLLVLGTGSLVLPRIVGSSSSPTGRVLVEAQVQGLGSYVRMEEAELAMEAHRKGPLLSLLSELKNQITAVPGEQREAIEQRIAEVESSLAKAERAERALQGLYAISGVTPSQ